MPRALRDPVVADVCADLHAAYGQGRTPETVLGMTVAEFAEQVARENGWLVAWPMYGRLLASAAVGAAAAILAGFALVLPSMYLVLAAVGHVLVWAGSDAEGYRESSLNAGIVYAMYALFGVGFVAAVLTAVRWGLKAAVQLRQTLSAGAVLIAVSAAVSVPLAVAIGHVSRFSSAPLVVAAEFGLVLGLAGAALVAARAWALRLS
ncbi:hypothetical protein [Kineococcus rubinsiae]|uniref:hypothetical protein n=1 Tax=Kineococcus rubinsiae TaxID=2609562 RepID=UPI0014304682|nr:hypothetical protein [Kineococcus rubinsiae]NIZ90318.1 hypothetical protein [Kineococcus rubinsiae]